MSAAAPLAQYQPPPADDDALGFAQRRIVQLSALLYLTYGGAGEEFRNSNETMQDNALWLAHDLTEEIENALKEVSRAKVLA